MISSTRLMNSGRRNSPSAFIDALAWFCSF